MILLLTLKYLIKINIVIYCFIVSSFFFSDKAVAVPDQLDKFIARKHYLNATKLLVDTGN